MSNNSENSIKYQESNFPFVTNTGQAENLQICYDAGYLQCQQNYETKLQWISVKEKLPNENGRYLTKSNNGYIDVLSYKSNMWSTVGYQSDITHWLSLSFL